VNLNGATLRVRVYAESASNTWLTGRVDAPSAAVEDSYVLNTNLGWQEFSTKLPASGYQASTSVQLALYAAGVPESATKVYVDWIRFDGGEAGPWDFSASSSPIKFTASGSDVTGTLSWLKN
jgi:hypothetical protein